MFLSVTGALINSVCLQPCRADSQDAANDTGRFKCDTDWVYKTGGGQTIVSEVNKYFA